MCVASLCPNCPFLAPSAPLKFTWRGCAPQVAIAPILPGLGSVPGMPGMGMPGMMPGMGMPGMPAMPGMPGMPGAFQAPGMDAAALDDDKDGLKLSAATRYAPLSPLLLMAAAVHPVYFLSFDRSPHDDCARRLSERRVGTCCGRASLMQRLAGGAAPAAAPAGAAGPSFVSGIPTSLPGPPGMPGIPGIPGMPGMPGVGPSGAGGEVPMEQGLLGAPSPIPTECLLLKNLFDPTTETEEDWHLDIAEDVKEECGKHGPVDHIFVDKDSRVSD